jgi:starvation-inducible DNA-binding protein
MDNMEELISALKSLVADQYVIYHKAHGYHWNVEGIYFAMFHDLFAEIYEDVYDSIDPTAENIRKIGGYAPFTMTRLQELRTIPDVDVSTNPMDMVEDLYNANMMIIKSIVKVFTLATALNEQGIANLMADRQDMHEKWCWQLRVSMKQF